MPDLKTGKYSTGKWIHDRAHRIMEESAKKGKPVKKSVAYAIATQQAHATGKAPKQYGTPEGKAEAKSKYDKSKKDYQKTAGGYMDPIQNLIDQAIAQQMAYDNEPSSNEKTAGVSENLIKEALVVADELEKIAEAIPEQDMAALRDVLGRNFGTDKAEVLLQRLMQVKQQQDQMAQPPAPAPPPAAAAPPVQPAQPAQAPPLDGGAPVAPKMASLERLKATLGSCDSTETFNTLKQAMLNGSQPDGYDKLKALMGR